LAWPRIEQLAPGFSQRIVARRILTALAKRLWAGKLSIQRS